MDFQINKFSAFQSGRDNEINRLRSELKAKIESNKSVPSSIDDFSRLEELSSLTGKTLKIRKKRKAISIPAGEKTKVKESAPSNQEHKSQDSLEVSEKMSLDEMSFSEMTRRKFDESET